MKKRKASARIVEKSSGCEKARKQLRKSESVSSGEKKKESENAGRKKWQRKAKISKIIIEAKSSAGKRHGKAA